MHSVSPVHIRVDSHIKNPMRATDFEDLLNKTKKRVQIGSSSLLLKKQNAEKRVNKKNEKTSIRRARSFTNSPLASSKSKSLSPVKSKSATRWCPPPGRTTKSVSSSKIDKNKPRRNQRLCEILNECDHIPVRESSIHQKITRSKSRDSSSSSFRHLERAGSCEVCADSSVLRQSYRSRSNDSVRSGGSSSRSWHYRSLSPIPIAERKSEKQPSGKKKRRHSLSPSMTASSGSFCSSSHLNRSTMDQNGTYSIPARTKSHDSSLRSKDLVPTCSIDPYQMTDVLINRLVDTESCSNEIAKHLGGLREFLLCELNMGPCELVHHAPFIVKRLDYDRCELLKRLELFELVNHDLRAVIYDLIDYKSAGNQRSLEENGNLIRHIQALEAENNRYKQALCEFEANVKQTGSAYKVLNIENNILNNLKSSLEDNRAHLRRQLIAKESECNRLSVQINTLNKKLDRAQLEIQLLRENRERAGLSSLKFPEPTSSMASVKPKQVANKKPAWNRAAPSTKKNIQLSRQVYTLEEVLRDPIKIRLYVEKLNKQIKEKDLAIKELNDVIAQQRTSIIHSNLNPIHEEKSSHSGNYNFDNTIELESLRRENERLRMELNSKEEKLRKIEAQIVSDKTNKARESYRTPRNESSHQKFLDSARKRLGIENSNSSADEEDFTTNLSHQISARSATSRAKSHRSKSNNNKDVSRAEDEESDLKINRENNFIEKELNEVRARLQQRLNELEPLPELLKSTESKLNESMLKLKHLETENHEYKNLVTKLKFQLDLAEKENSLKKKEKKTIASDSVPNSARQASVDKTQQQPPLGSSRQNKSDTGPEGSKLGPTVYAVTVKHYEEQNKELIKLLGLKEDLIRDLTSKLTTKAQEATSLRRQLELALSDSMVKEQQLREKIQTKERSLQARCVELEGKLASMQFHSDVHSRDKDELAQEHVSQLKDIKAKLEQTQQTNRQLQDYVNFLKNSYISYFDDTSSWPQFESGFTSY